MGMGGVAMVLLRPKYYWKNHRRLFLFLLLLICCCPVLVPLFLLSLPFLLCLAASRFRLGPRRARRRGVARKEVSEAGVEVEVKSPPMLQRYLEEQMGLVVVGIGSAAVDCGGDEGDLLD